MKTEVVSRAVRGFVAIAALGVLLGACGGNSAKAPTYETTLFAWQEDTFQRDVSQYAGATQLRVMLTQPSSGKVVSTKTFSLDDGSAKLPKLAFGENLRLDFHLLNFSKEVVGAGATPTFKSGPETPGIQFDVLIAEPESFSPVGALYSPNEGDSIPCESNVDKSDEYCQSRFDGRAKEGPQHRAGHTSAASEDGRVLYVGGGQVNATTLTARIPGMQKVFDGVQVFTPSDGYVTNLAYDAKNRTIRGSDTLSVGRAYSEVTPIGDGQFLVTGGYWVDENGNETPVRNIDLINLDADPGQRVRQPKTAGGENMKLNKARARHTATYLPSLDSVLIIGGVTRSRSATDSITVINLAQRRVGEVGTLKNARMAHEAARLGDTGSKSRVWVVGGRGDNIARSSTEYVTIDSDRTLTVSEGGSMNVSRYDFSLLEYSTEDADLFLAAGGYTSTGNDGRPTASVEVGNPDKSSTWLGNIAMQTARGGPTALRLPGSRGATNVVVAGGRDGMGRPVGTIQKVSYEGSGDVPFSNNGIADAMVTPRYESEVEITDNGRVVFAGGIDDAGAMVQTLEYYTPSVRESFANPGE